jgi:hypothetical protein
VRFAHGFGNALLGHQATIRGIDTILDFLTRGGGTGSSGRTTGAAAIRKRCVSEYTNSTARVRVINKEKGGEIPWEALEAFFKQFGEVLHVVSFIFLCLFFPLAHSSSSRDLFVLNCFSISNRAYSPFRHLHDIHTSSFRVRIEAV